MSEHRYTFDTERHGKGYRACALAFDAVVFRGPKCATRKQALQAFLAPWSERLLKEANNDKATR